MGRKYEAKGSCLLHQITSMFEIRAGRYTGWLLPRLAGILAGRYTGRLVYRLAGVLAGQYRCQPGQPIYVPAGQYAGLVLLGGVYHPVTQTTLHIASRSTVGHGS